MHESPKYVVRSNSLSVDWNNSSSLSPYSVDEIRKLKDRTDGGLYVSGSGTLRITSTLGEVVDFPKVHRKLPGTDRLDDGLSGGAAEQREEHLAAFGELEFTTVEVVERADALAVRSRAEGTHIGTFLGIAPTGRRIAWDNVAIVHVDAGKVAGQWIEADPSGIYQQLTASVTEPPRIARAESALAWAHSRARLLIG